jgi:hypothetical protein
MPCFFWWQKNIGEVWGRLGLKDGGKRRLEWGKKGRREGGKEGKIVKKSRPQESGARKKGKKTLKEHWIFFFLSAVSNADNSEKSSYPFLDQKEKKEKKRGQGAQRRYEFNLFVIRSRDNIKANKKHTVWIRSFHSLHRTGIIFITNNNWFSFFL